MQPIISFEQFSFQYKHAAQPTVKTLRFIYILVKSINCWTKWFRKINVSSLYQWANPVSYEGVALNYFYFGKRPRKKSVFELSKHVGTILQDQDAQFIGLTVEEDVAFYLENECVNQDEMKKIVSSH